jgi:hypothetical protein
MRRDLWRSAQDELDGVDERRPPLHGRDPGRPGRDRAFIAVDGTPVVDVHTGTPSTRKVTEPGP